MKRNRHKVFCGHAQIVAVLFVVMMGSFSRSPVSAQPDPRALVLEIFHQEYEWLRQYTTRDHLSSIYDVQAFTNPLLVMAIREQRFGLIDSLAAIIMHGTTTLRETVYYPLNNFRGLDSVKMGEVYRMWLFPRTLRIDDVQVVTREEYHLSSSQFLFLASQVLHAAVNVPRGIYPLLDSFMQVMPPVMLHHHYRRWIIAERTFRLSGWGCARGTYTHREFLRMKAERKFRFKRTICPVVNDIDLFIIAGVAQVVAAYHQAPEQVPISSEDLSIYKAYLSEAESLLKSRIELRPIHTAQGILEGFAFDNGLYRDNKDHRWALYNGAAFPPSSLKPKTPTDASWDLSHARRFFFVFNALDQAKEGAGLTLDYQRYLDALAHQFCHVVYADTVRHLFSNYLNGDNGWYRVDYHGKGFGYPPYSMSQAALEGGWFFLGDRYQPIQTLGTRLWEVFHENPQYYNQYYGVLYRNYEPVTRKFSSQPRGSERFVLLQWLPSLTSNTEKAP